MKNKELEVSIWCRLGAYIKLPQSKLQEVFGECNQAKFEKLDFKKLYEEGKIEFNGDSYIPEESCYTTAPTNGERHSCPHCGGKLIPSTVEGYAWFCPDCDEDFCNVELKD